MRNAMDKMIKANRTEALMNSMLRTLSIISLILTMVAGPALAKGKGTSGAQFLRIGVGARGPGMAGAYSPIVDDATAIYWNPAGLAMLEKKDVQISYNAYFEDTAAQFVGYAHPTSKGVFGGAADMFSVQDIDKRSAAGGDADDPDQGTFNTQDMAISAAWANKLEIFGGKMHYGVALKYIRSDLELEKAQTAAVDLGVIHHLGQSGFTASLAVLNLGGQLKFQDEADPLPLNIKPGLAYRRAMGRLGKLNAVVDADLLVYDGIGYVQPGVEWWPVEMFALRGGYQFGRDENAGSGVGLGAGFRMRGVGLDYAFVPYGDLGDTHRFSLGYRF